MPHFQGCSGAGTRGDGVPHFFSTGGTRPPLPPLFWTEIRANVKLHGSPLKSWNATTYAKTWLRKHRSATDTQTRVAVSQPKIRCGNFFDVYECMSGLNCLKTLRLSLVSGVPTSFLGLHPCSSRSSVLLRRRRRWWCELETRRTPVAPRWLRRQQTGRITISPASPPHCQRQQQQQPQPHH